jgi:STE24 endopeptidase
MTRGRVLLAVSAVAVAVACVLAGRALWDTIVPGGLELPDVPDGAFGREQVEEARSFEALQRVLAIGSQVALVAVLIVYAKRGTRLIPQSAAGPIGTGSMLAILGLCLVWLVQLPFGLVETWWSRRHDVVEVGYLEWLLESFLGLSAMALQVSVILLIVMGLARLVRAAWWLPAVAALGGVIFLLAWLGSYLIVDTDEPSPAIQADARKLARDEGLPDIPVRVEEVREFTSQPNAYAIGLGDTRKVVLWDTLTEDFPRREVRVVLAHELAHHEHRHIAKGVAWLLVVLLPSALIVAAVTRRRGGMGLPEAVPLALLVFTLLTIAVTPLQSAASRRYEAEADWAALQATRDPRGMEELFKGFTSEALADPNPPGWWHAWFDSHPSGAERVAMARAWRAAQQR